MGNFRASQYSPDLVSSDFHLFPQLKAFLEMQGCNDSELQATVMTWLEKLATMVFRQKVKKLVQHYNKC